MLNPQVARMEHEIASSADLIQDRDARIAEQNRMLYQLEADAQDLRNQLAAARNEITAAGERLTAARAAAETQLRSANDVLSERSTQMRESGAAGSTDSDRLAGQRDATAQALSGDIATLKAESAAASARWADEKRALETELAAREQTLAERARWIADAERQARRFRTHGDAARCRRQIAAPGDLDAAGRGYGLGGVVARPQDLARRPDRDRRRPT